PLRSLGGAREALRQEAGEAARQRLERLRGMGAGERAEIHLREGRPAPEILRLAGEVGADLIVVGEQGPRRGIGALLGSTAERVLFESRVPVLLARKLADAPPRRLLAAIDDSEMAVQVLASTAVILRRFS